ncbi:Histidine kinase-like ATPase domain-containing protein [Asanoa hainanensis]|uniref:Histidine kinase-like ATPase domain-containing protein n=2 Tax=Asanoa hainanensis TaxID=560556 RepID=A0A239KDD5_9ACTN|nr:Histidine kinase-like ATPase domain-containing protein [Asanoa hainanensis]
MHNGAIMPTDVHFLVADDDPYAVVQLQGVLDQRSAEALRGALLSVVADRTPAVIEVTGLRIDDPTVLSTFGEVARETADWPAGQPVISVPPAVADPWRGVGFRLADGDRRAAGFSTETLLRAGLDPVPGAARRARELVTEACARWELPEVAGPACIVVTELVNNVVAHAQTAMTVLVGRGTDGDTLHLSVRDWSPALPVYGGPVPTTAYGGRGLLLIEAVALRWGVSDLPDGKVVWSVVAPDDDE